MPREVEADRHRTPPRRAIRAWLARLSAALVALAASVALLPAASASASPSCHSGTCVASFGYRGAVEEWTVPNGVTSLSFVVDGAGGGGGLEAAQAGSGAKVEATEAVSAGERLELVVGGAGAYETGGYGGGGEGGHDGVWGGGGGGGGGSFVFAEGAGLLIAAGGGGGVGDEPAGGGSGGQSGTPGGSTNGPSGENHENGGRGATDSGPGTPGPNGKKGAGPTSTTAIEGTGGKGGAAEAAGGGGGGGYYGGGGGGSWWFSDGDGGGGGGSSIAVGATGVSYETGAGGHGAASYGKGENGAIELSFAQPTTTVALTSSSPSTPLGQAVTYTATVSPVPDGGKVAFADGGSTLSACREVAVSTSTGKASCQVTYATRGLHAITAAYLGSSDTIYPAAESSATTVAATGPTTTSLHSASIAPRTGWPVLYTATVSPAPSGGTVAFEDGGSPIAGCGAQAVEPGTGTATCEVTYDFPGVHAIGATFSGSPDETDASSSTASPTTVVASESTTTSLLSTTTSAIVGGPVTYTATVSPAPDGGTVAFEDGGAPIPGCAAQAVDPTGGTATCQLTYGSPGVHAIAAVFSGSTDGSYTSSSTAAPTTVIASQPTTVSLESSSAAPLVGSPVTLTATVSPAPDGGTVDFEDAGATLAGCGASAIDPSSGAATCEATFGSAGAHELTATFSGSGDLTYIGSSTPWYSELVATEPATPPSIPPSTPSAPAASAGLAAAASSPPAAGERPRASDASGGSVKLEIVAAGLATLLARHSLLLKETSLGIAGESATSVTLELPGAAAKLSLGSVRAALSAGQSRYVRLALSNAVLGAIRRYVSHLGARSVTIAATISVGGSPRSWTATRSLRAAAARG